jgi:hypothetical protein
MSDAVGNLEVTEERKAIALMTISRIADYISARKIDPNDSTLVKNAADGFNLACDFLAHELRAMASKETQELLK